MDVSYSVWREVAAEKLEIGGDSFSFLFDRRYSNRLNRMSRVFFEAYARATREVSAEEDRFPSLSEIESRMESGAIYAYKDRLMRATEFFEEVKISGISYLIPKARRFVDETGTYTDLILDLEKGEVVLPRREKPSAISRLEGAETEEESADVEELEGEEEDLMLEEVEAPSETVEAAEEPPEGAEPGEKIPEEVVEEMSPTEPVAGTSPAEAPKDEGPLEMVPFEAGVEKEAPVEEGPKEDALVEMKGPNPEMEEGEKGEKVAESEGRQTTPREAAPFKPRPPEKNGGGFGGWDKDHKGPLLALTGLALIIVIAALYIWWPSSPEEPATPAVPSDFVSYSAYLTNVSGNTYLNLDVTNPKGLESRVELILPPDVDRSISATGGIITIFYTNNTVIQLASSNNASVSVALTDKYVLVPVTFNLAIPQDYESSILVYDKDYKVSRTNSNISLWCNCTDEHLDFDQIYNAKNVSGGPGPKGEGPENATSVPSAGPSGPEPKDGI